MSAEVECEALSGSAREAAYSLKLPSRTCTNTCTARHPDESSPKQHYRNTALPSLPLALVPESMERFSHQNAAISYIFFRGKKNSIDSKCLRSLTHILSFSSLPTPIGIAVDKNGLMYFVDATMIRKVDQNGIISTLLGANDLTAVRPLSCDSSMDVSQVRLFE